MIRKTLKGFLLVSVSSLVFSIVPVVNAETESSEGFTSDWVALGLGIGVYVPTIVNEMLPHVTLGLDVGLLLPFHDRRLSIVVGAAWTPPGRDGSEYDPRIDENGETWTYDMTTHEVLLTLGTVYRILAPGTAVIVPYIGLTARCTVLVTKVTGSANGADFGENTETSTQIGGTIFAGGEVTLGPGGLFFELVFGISDLPHLITGDTNTGALALNVGYRLFL